MYIPPRFCKRNVGPAGWPEKAAVWAAYGIGLSRLRMQAREARRHASEDSLPDAERVLDLGPHLGPDQVISPLKLVHHRAYADAAAIQ